MLKPSDGEEGIDNLSIVWSWIPSLSHERACLSPSPRDLGQLYMVKGMETSNIEFCGEASRSKSGPLNGGLGVAWRLFAFVGEPHSASPRQNLQKSFYVIHCCRYEAVRFCGRVLLILKRISMYHKR